MQEVEKKAIEVVMEYEKKQGRNPKDVSMDRKEAGYDISSDDRKIEVKGIGGRNGFVWLNSYNFETFRKEPNFYLYVVFDVKTEPKIIIYDKIELTGKINEGSVDLNFCLPLRNKDWEKGI